ncbi:hypothetical protein [Aliiroseovarius sp. S253]
MRITLALLALLIATPTHAGVFQTPAGGWGVTAPDVPSPRPRPKHP